MRTNAGDVGNGMIRPMPTAWRLAPIGILTAALLPPGVLAGGRGVAQRNNTNLIDLVQVGLNLPGKITPGKRFRALDRVENQGEAGSLPTVTYFYLSVDDQVDEQDLVIAGRRVPALAPGASHEDVTAMSIAATVPSGDYYILVACDATRQMDERYENNNTRAVKVRVLAAESR